MDLIPGLIIVTILGLGWGSFATMAIYRLPHNLPWIGNKPFCPSCKHSLSFRDYVSVISFLSRRGTCRYCGIEYGRRGLYLYTEIATTIVFIISFLVFNISETFILVTGLGTALVILSAIEIEHKQLHPKVLLMLLILALIARTLQDGSIYGIMYHGGLSALVGLGIRHFYFLFKGRFKEGCDYLEYKEKGRFSGEGMSYVFLVIVAGVWLGILPMLIVLSGAILFNLLSSLLFINRLFSLGFGLFWLGFIWYYSVVLTS